jgi:mono/diheme cytochrome c family protein
MRKVSVVIALLTFALIGIVSSSVPNAAAAAAPAGDPVKGQKIYVAQKCSVCHNGKMAEDLMAIGSKRDAAWLAKYLVAPTPLDPKNPPKVKMTPVKVTGQDLDDLVAYLASLKKK